MRAGTVCGGALCVDRNLTIDRYPPPEEVALIQDETLDLGGPAFNVSVDLARLGAPFPVEIMGVVGDDANGAFARQVCSRAGIGTRGLGVLPGVPTSYTDVMIEMEGGRRTFFHREGANALLGPEHFDFTGTTARILHLGAPGVLERLDQATPDGNGFTEILARARAAGLETNMELVGLAPERIRALARPCLPLLDTIIVNELEAGAVTGIETHVGQRSDWSRVEAAGRALLDGGVERLAVIHFPEGGVAVPRGGQVRRQGAVRVPPADVRSTNGAGDAFASGVLLGLHEGWPLEDCLRLAVSVAAVSLSSYSTSGAIRPWAECLAHGERYGFRAAE